MGYHTELMGQFWLHDSSNYYKRFGHDDLAIWTTEGIMLHSKNLRLEWSNNNFPGKRWGGFPGMRLILPGEPYEPPSTWS